MKTSNKLLIGFLAVVFIGVLTTHILTRNTTDLKEKLREMINLEEVIQDEMNR